jgi:hypothetical protein
MLRRLQLALKLMLPLTRGCRLVSSRIVGRARLPRLMLRRLQLLAEFYAQKANEHSISINANGLVLPSCNTRPFVRAQVEKR